MFCIWWLVWFVLGVRVNVPVDTLLLTLSATDLDSDASTITFHLESITFSRYALAENKTYFSIDNSTGEIRTASSMIPFSDGFFTLTMFATNSPNRTLATVKVSIASKFYKTIQDYFVLNEIYLLYKITKSHIMCYHLLILMQI